MRALIIGIAVLVAFASAAPVFAQTGTASPDTTLIIISPRSVADIQSDLQDANDIASRADGTAKAVRALYETAASRAEMQKKEVESIKAKIDLAKKEKKDAEVVSLEAQRQGAEQLKSVYERERDLRKAEADYSEAEGERASAASKAYQLEIELAKKRSEVVANTSASALDKATAVQVLRDLEGRTLEAQLEMAKKTQKLAEQEKTLVERRLALFKAQTKS